MADKPSEFLTGWVRINVSKADGGRAAPYGWLLREVSVPTRPAIPDQIHVTLVKNHRVLVKCSPLIWDCDQEVYRLGDVTIVLTTAEIERLHAAEPQNFHADQ